MCFKRAGADAVLTYFAKRRGATAQSRITGRAECPSLASRRQNGRLSHPHTGSALNPRRPSTRTGPAEAPPLRVNRTRTGITGQGGARPRGRSQRSASVLQPRAVAPAVQHPRARAGSRSDAHPLLNRVMFLLIFSSNMDEFFEIRVAGLKHQLMLGDDDTGC